MKTVGIDIENVKEIKKREKVIVDYWKNARKKRGDGVLYHDFDNKTSTPKGAQASIYRPFGQCS